MATLRIQVGDLALAPSETEQEWGAIGLGVAVLGFLSGSSSLKAIGILAIAGAALSVYEEAQTFTDPELMNGFFQTGGALSATRGTDDANALRWGQQ
jgi:hypothetical protein